VSLQSFDIMPPKSLFSTTTIIINRSKIGDLIIILSYRLCYCSNCSNFGHCVFEPHLVGLKTTYDVLLGLIEKRVVDFLSVLTELFPLGVTAEALRLTRGK